MAEANRNGSPGSYAFIGCGSIFLGITQLVDYFHQSSPFDRPEKHQIVVGLVGVLIGLGSLGYSAYLAIDEKHAPRRDTPSDQAQKKELQRLERQAKILRLRKELQDLEDEK